MGPNDEAYVERLVAGPFRYEERITLIVSGGFAGPAWAKWLGNRLAAGGFKKERQSKFRTVEVHVFRANKPKPAAAGTGRATIPGE